MSVSASASASASWPVGAPVEGEGNGGGIPFAAMPEEGGTSLVQQAQNEVQNRILDYPRDFFHPLTGKNHPDPTLLWQYRKDRPMTGYSETKPPNGEEMKKEIEAIRASLRDWIIQSYVESVRLEAKGQDMRIVSTNQFPVTDKDLSDIVGAYANNEENQMKVFAAFHKFHRDRGWLASKIDEWFVSNNMLLQPLKQRPTITADGEQMQRRYIHDRGGFSVVARQAKSQAIGKFMNRMLHDAGWCIATTKKETKQRNYKKVTRANDKGTMSFFYVVTANHSPEAMANLKVT